MNALVSNLLAARKHCSVANQFCFIESGRDHRSEKEMPLMNKQTCSSHRYDRLLSSSTERSRMQSMLDLAEMYDGCNARPHGVLQAEIYVPDGEIGYPPFLGVH